jgi:hypothetical protein
MTNPQTTERKDKKENSNFQIDAFLKENYELFAIMGVFGALSVYLTNLSADSNTLSATGDAFIIQIGIASSFILFILVSFVIFWKAREKIRDMSPPNVSLKTVIDNSKLVLFTVPFYMLIAAIAYYVIDAFSKHLEIVFGMIIFMLGAISSFGFLSMMDNKVKSKVLYIFIGPLFLSFISFLGLYFVRDCGLIALLFLLMSTGVVSASLLITKLIDLMMIFSIQLRENHKKG